MGNSIIDQHHGESEASDGGTAFTVDRFVQAGSGQRVWCIIARRSQALRIRGLSAIGVAVRRRGMTAYPLSGAATPARAGG